MLLFFLDKNIKYELLNIGTGEDISIKDLAILISKKLNFDGEIKWNITKPDGMLKKCMDITKFQKFKFNRK